MSVLGLVDLSKREDSARDGYFREYFQMMEESIINWMIR